MSRADKILQTIDRQRIDRFWSKVQKTEKCWLWTGCKDDGGYGIVRVNRSNLLAHRIAWFATFKSIPSKCLLHSCDNPTCVNPDHLREGTRGENNTDRHQKGRSALGEKHGCAKLQKADVVRIKQRIKSGEPLTRIAEDYPVKAGAISKIATGRLWKSI